ncbi:MAG: two-component system NarL family sensor kinase [Acidimicrobiales bacterium]|jgi:two-component system NarL family sensor kinase
MRRRLGWLRGAFVQFAIAGAIGTLAISVGGLVASRRAGEAEAMAEVRAQTATIARVVLEPNLSPELLAGDPAALARFDAIVTERVLDGSTVRVKLWDADGRIVYSDEPRLIGEQYELDDEQIESLSSGSVVSEISSLDGPENRFEVDESQMLEVYLPVVAPDGRPLLYESYFSMSTVGASSGRIRAEFVPILVGALLLVHAMNLTLAWLLNLRLGRNQRARERLLNNAIEASDIERRRIAADIHGGVVQDLAGTSSVITAAAESAAAISPDLARDLRSASVSTRRSLQSLRSLLVDMYPPNLRTQGLRAALVDLLVPGSNLGIDCKLSTSGDVDDRFETTALIYRVVQEAVRNVFRHADATSLEVSVIATGSSTIATVTDNGKGFQYAGVSTNSYFGLRLITDLATEAGAAMKVASTPGSGTTIEIEVPVDQTL